MSGSAVTLRAIEADDWQVVHSWSQLLDFCRYQPWGPASEDDARSFAAKAAAAWTDTPQTRYVYLVNVGDRVVGEIELRIRHAVHRRGEIGYGLHPREWGRGYGTAAARAVLKIGFDELDLHRIVATCDPRNVGSARVLAKAGMTYEGRMRHTKLIRDGWRDSEMFSILEDEWRASGDPAAA